MPVKVRDQAQPDAGGAEGVFMGWHLSRPVFCATPGGRLFETGWTSPRDFMNAVYEEAGSRIEEDFPQAAAYRAGWERATDWSEVEGLRAARLPARPAGARPTLVIVGIGKEWEWVERYARAGYHLVLVDKRPGVEQFFRQIWTEQIAPLEKTQGVTIDFVRADITSNSFLTDFVAGHEGRIDVVEYHYVDDLDGLGAPAVDGLLRPGGLFIQHHPLPIVRTDLEERGYRTLRHEAFIPAVLETTSTRLAYPIGTHLLVAQKRIP